MGLTSMGREYKCLYQWVIHCTIDVHAINATVQHLKYLPLHLRQWYFEVYTDILWCLKQLKHNFSHLINSTLFMTSQISGEWFPLQNRH